MKTIWKYPLDLTDTQNIFMPEGAEILSAQMQGDTLCLWALVNSESPKQRREIEILGTGNQASDVPRSYISTVQERRFVWHVFERL